MRTLRPDDGCDGLDRILATRISSDDGGIHQVAAALSVESGHLFSCSLHRSRSHGVEIAVRSRVGIDPDGPGVQFGAACQLRADRIVLCIHGR